MPDQSEAATEHALMQEITGPLSTLPDDPVPIAADTDFPIVLRGYDRIAVDAYVKRTSQLVAELQATRSPEAAIRRALERVGEQISGILQRAHETSQQITSQSRAEAEDRLESARREARQITAAAEQRVHDLDAETDRIWAERQRIVEDARALAGQLLDLAEEASKRFPPDEEAAAGGGVAGVAPGVGVEPEAGFAPEAGVAPEGGGAPDIGGAPAIGGAPEAGGAPDIGGAPEEDEPTTVMPSPVVSPPEAAPEDAPGGQDEGAEEPEAPA